MQLKMTKPDTYAVDIRALILTADMFEDTELMVPYFRLLEAGARVDIGAPTMDRIGGEHGYSVAPDLTIDAVDPDEYELLDRPRRLSRRSASNGAQDRQGATDPPSRSLKTTSQLRPSATGRGCWLRQV